MSQGCEKTRLRGSERTIGREVDLSPIFVTLSVSPAITGTESTGTAAWGAAVTRRAVGPDAVVGLKPKAALLPFLTWTGLPKPGTLSLPQV